MQSVVFAWLVTMLLREPADERVGYAQMSILLPGMLLILCWPVPLPTEWACADRRYGRRYLLR